MRALATDALRNFRFLVTIMGSSALPQSIGTLGFMSVDGFAVQNEVIPYREGGDNTTAIPLGSHVLTVNGWKLMGDIEVGDRIIDPKGQESKVIDLLPSTVKEVYQVTLGDGSIALACFGHFWEVEIRDSNNKKKTETITTLQMKGKVDARFGNGTRHFHVRVPKIKPMTFDVGPELPLDPYLLGILLAEGSLEKEGVSFAQEEANEVIIDRCRQALPEGHSLRPEYQNGIINSWAVTVGNNGVGARNINGRNKVLAAVRELGLLGHRAWEKFIPEIYKWASIEDRLALLQGLMDGDGWVDSRHCTSFSSSSQQLTNDVTQIIQSLGGRCGTINHATERTYVNGHGVRRPARDKWEFNGVSDLEMNPFTLPRKSERFLLSAKTSSQFRSVRSVESIGFAEVRCLEVSAPSHLFITDDFVPSHNTRKMPGQTDFGPISMARGMMAGTIGSQGTATTNGSVVNSSGSSEVYQWLQMVFSAMEGQGTGQPTDNFRSDITVDVLEHPVVNKTSGAGVINGTPPIKARFYIYNAWPMGLTWSGLDAGGNAVMVETLQLAHEGFQTLYASNTPGQYLSSSATP